MKRLFLFGLISVFSCSQDPVGFDELGRGREPLVVFPDVAGNQGAYGEHIALGLADNLICGKDGSYEARMIMQFELTDSLADSLDSLKLVLYNREELTDSLVAFSIYLVTASWNEYQATWMMANSNTRWLKPGGEYDSIAIGQGRFGAESTVVDLYAVRSQLADSTHYGILLIPEENGFAAVYSSGNTSKGPKLVLAMNDGEQQLTPIQDSYFVNSELGDVPDGQLWVGSGYAYRSYLRFNLDSLPALVRITSAELSVRIDNIVAATETLGLEVHRLKEAWDKKYTEYEVLPVARERFTKEDTMVVFDIRGLVQGWADDSTTNYGLLITVWPEYDQISRVELYPAADSARRPRLICSYIEPPKPRF